MQMLLGSFNYYKLQISLNLTDFVNEPLNQLVIQEQSSRSFTAQDRLGQDDRRDAGLTASGIFARFP